MNRLRRAFRRRPKTSIALVVVVVGLALFARTFLASPLPAPSPLADPLPVASPPPSMAVHAVGTGAIHRNAGVGYRGGSFLESRDFAMTGVLVSHPRGDVLIDTGLGERIDEQFQLMPAAFRALTTLERTRSVAAQLDARGYDRKKLRGVILTHAHWDHVSGTPDFPETPILVTKAERRFVDEGGVVTAVARSNTTARYEEYDFEGGPYLGYPRSHDFYGDGAIVAVPAPGHTPGSVLVFLALPDGSRYAMLGDLVWQLEGITEREEKPWLVRTMVDDDETGVRTEILHVAAIHAKHPQIALVPAHDSRAFAAMPQF